MDQTTHTTHTTHTTCGRHQVDGGWAYTMANTSSTPDLTYVIATNPAGANNPIQLGSPKTPLLSTPPSGSELWYVNTQNLGLLVEGENDVIVSRASFPIYTTIIHVPVMSSSTATSGYSNGVLPPTSSDPYLPPCSEQPSWSSSPPTFKGTPYYFVGIDADNGDTLYMGWDISGGAKGPWSLNQIVWYLMTTTAPTTTVDPSGTFAWVPASKMPTTGYYQSASS
jgi:hypothetical protein